MGESGFDNYLKIVGDHVHGQIPKSIYQAS